MALVVKDRVRENSTTTGTGTFTLSGAVSGFQTFSSAIGNTNTTYYSIVNNTEWEVGIGTVGAGTLSRDTVLSSSTGSKISFTSGTKDVFCTYPAGQSIYYNNSTKVAVTGGAIWENTNTIASSYTISTNTNAMSTGTVTINSGVTVTVPTGSRWVIV